MKKISLSTCFIFIGFILFFFLSIIAMITLFPKINDESKATFWNELIKMVFSSLLSAGVAYIVSAVQNNSIRNRSEEDEDKVNERRIKLLVIEIEDNKKVLNELRQVDFQANDTLLEKQLSTKVFDMFLDKLILDDVSLENLIKYDKKISLFMVGTQSQRKATYPNLESNINKVLDNLTKLS